MNKYKYVILNSTLLFMVATILEMTLHECGHFIMAILVHASGVSLHHNYVSDNDDSVSLASNLLVKGMGPAVSLLIGIIFHIVCKKYSGRNLLFLFFLYMSVFGYIGFFGYLLIAPLFTGGDTGYICHALNFPMTLTVSIAVAGLIILYLLIRNLTPYFVSMGTEAMITDAKERRQFIKALVMWPLYAGIIITTLLNLPIPTFLSLIAPIFSPFTLFWTFGLALDKKYPSLQYNLNFEKFNSLSTVLIIVSVLIIVMNRLLVPGIHWN